MSTFLPQFIADNFLRPKQEQFVHADSVLEKIQYDTQIVDSELLISSDADMFDSNIIGKAIYSTYVSHLNKVLAEYGVVTTGDCLNIQLLASLLDTFILAIHQYDSKVILDQLILDADKSDVEIYANLVTSLTGEDQFEVIEAIYTIKPTCLTSLVDVLTEKPSPDMDTSEFTYKVERYKKFLNGRRYGIVYQVIQSSGFNNIGKFDPREMYLLVEEVVDDELPMKDWVYEIATLILASKAEESEFPTLIEFFANTRGDTARELLTITTDLNKAIQGV